MGSRLSLCTHWRPNYDVWLTVWKRLIEFVDITNTSRRVNCVENWTIFAIDKKKVEKIERKTVASQTIGKWKWIVAPDWEEDKWNCETDFHQTMMKMRSINYSLRISFDVSSIGLCVRQCHSLRAKWFDLCCHTESHFAHCHAIIIDFSWANNEFLMNLR